MKIIALLAAMIAVSSPCHANYRALMENANATNNAFYLNTNATTSYLLIGGNETIVSTLTVLGNAFSVGTTSFTVLGGNVGIKNQSPRVNLDNNLPSGSTYYYNGDCPTPAATNSCEFSLEYSVASGSSVTIHSGPGWILSGGTSVLSGHCQIEIMSQADANRTAFLDERITYGPTFTQLAAQSQNASIAIGTNANDALEIKPTTTGVQLTNVYVHCTVNHR